MEILTALSGRKGITPCRLPAQELDTDLWPWPCYFLALAFTVKFMVALGFLMLGFNSTKSEELVMEQLCTQ